MHEFTCDVGFHLGEEVILGIACDVDCETGDPSVGERGLICNASFVGARMTIGKWSVAMTKADVIAAVGEGPINAAIEEAAATWERGDGYRPSDAPGWEAA